MLGVKFTDGTILPIFNTETIEIIANELEQYTLENALLYLGGTGWNGFAYPTQPFTMTDIAGNVWYFTLPSLTSINIKIVSPTNVTLLDYTAPSNYSVSSGWFGFLSMVSMTESDMAIQLVNRRPTFMRNDSRPAFYAAYLNSDYAGQYSYENDLQTISQDSRYFNIALRNNVTSGPFTSIVGAYKSSVGGSVSDFDYYLKPYASGSPLVAFTLGMDAIVDIRPEPEDTDPYSPGGNSTTGGGGMSGDPPTHDSIDFPDNPLISATKAGFVSIWTPTEGQVEKLAAYLWTTDILTGAFWKKIIQNPLDLIFGLQIMPVPIYHTEGESEPRREDEYLAMNDNVVLGWTNTRIKMDYIPEQFIEVDCGEIDMEEYWKAYLDYAPYTKIDIYLPYIGVKTLNTNDCMSRTIHLKYKIDLASGSCVAIIKCDDSVYYHFSGNCASAVPLTAVQMQEVIRNAMTTAVAVGAAVMTAGAESSPLAVGAAKAAAAASAARTVMTGPEYHRSGSNASTTGLMSVQTPYLIITRPRQALPENQNTYTGYPSFITEQIGDLTGYTEIEIIHMHDLTCTSEEFTEIEDLLLKGVII